MTHLPTAIAAVLLTLALAAETSAEEPRTPPAPHESAPASPDVAPIDWGDEWEEDWEQGEEDADAAPDLSDRDPFEDVNRGVFDFNQGADRLLFDPISRAYRFLMPDLGEEAVRNVFRNLEEPATFVNDLLQLELWLAGKSIARFALNSTVGVAGTWDPAQRLGIARHRADFGQTLSRISIPSGPYLVVPLLGPSTLRDAVGSIVDRLFLPQTYLLGVGPQLILRAGDGISLRAGYVDVLAELRTSSVDYYATIRSLYLVNREIELRGGLGLSDEEYEKVLAFGF